MEDYKLKNKKFCDCGYEFTIKDLTQLKRINEFIYGGTVKHISYTKCPKCKKETVLLLKQDGQTYKIIDIAQKDINTEVQNKEELQKQTEKAYIDDKIENKEFICNVCKKAFKNGSGLKLHLRTHQEV